ncbi:hypothetical protein AVEN_72718-1 [Araneus ventricosus]|uniref:Uncharacterized protein n=1 Tax=Araneus ventricosus TaxID=182803 RepID=A0A4Y2DRD0_ARAVE|nr:hypothetical protein AVEN_72718-1 [Araneus ventricosus]
MSEEYPSVQETSGKMNLNNDENSDEFDYSKISDETDAITEYLEKLQEEVTKMRVDCAVANIELISKINNINFERKVEELEKLFEEYSKSQDTSNDEPNQNK